MIIIKTIGLFYTRDPNITDLDNSKRYKFTFKARLCSISKTEQDILLHSNEKLNLSHDKDYCLIKQSL